MKKYSRLKIVSGKRKKISYRQNFFKLKRGQWEIIGNKDEVLGVFIIVIYINYLESNINCLGYNFVEIGRFRKRKMYL